MKNTNANCYVSRQSLGFRPLAGDAKVQLTPKWSPPPAPTASLLAIASRKAVVAAAGPDGITLASTDSVRKAFEADKNGDSEVRPFQAEIKIPMPMRVSHLAFTPDEQYLILSAEQGGGLAVYETQTLLQGSAQSAFEINTSGESVKTLAPNPMPELAEFCAVVTNNGNLLMANLKEKSLVQSANGPVIRSGVTCVGWSTKGKQLVAGMGDGSAVQMTPDGTEKAVIPKPEFLGDFHVASIAWLENHLFLAIYNENSGTPPNSEYFVITRSAPPREAASFEFRKMQDPIMPFGNETAPQYTVLRIRDYPPAIQELLIVASSVSDQLGLLTKAKAPLATDKPAEEITNVFTTTEFADDSRRATLPSDEEYNETLPIGVALDLSSKEKVSKPVPDDEEIESSPGPLPAAWALNNNGVLSAWWMIYYDAVREGTTFPGMAALQGEQSSQPSVPTTSAFGSQPKSSLFGGSSAFGSAAPALATPSAPSNPFGSTAAPSAPTFGAPSFGATSSLGGKPPTPAFGQSGGLGNKASPWATGSTNTAPAFGSRGFSSSPAPAAAGSTGGKVFGSSAAPAGSTTGSGFAGLAGQSGFASLGGDNKGGSIFSKPASSSPFGAPAGSQSAFGQSTGTGAFGSQQTSTSNDTAFPAAGSKAQNGGAFGSSPFVLGTTFKADPASANDNEKPSGKGGFSLGGFGVSLDDPASRTAGSNESKDEKMDATTPTEQSSKTPFGVSQASTTPSSTPAPSKFFSADNAASKPNPFGGPATTSNIFGSANVQPSMAKPNPFAQTDANKSKSSPSPFGSTGSIFSGGGDKPNPFSPNKPTSNPDAAETTAAPMPPDATSKAAYPFEESSSSSIASTKTTEDIKNPTKSVDDAPLPPDFLPSKGKPKADDNSAPPPLPKEESPVPEDAPLPPDFVTKPESGSRSLFQPPAAPAVPESPSDDLSEEAETDHDGKGEDEDEEGEGESEGSGIDVADDLSPVSAGAGQTPGGATPQSSFGGMGGSTFSLVSRPDTSQQPRGSFFGEQPRSAPFGGNAPPLPKPTHTSPGSPSPVRSAVPQRIPHGESSRSVSAPGVPSQMFGASRQPRSTGFQPPSSAYNKSISSRVQPKEDPNVALQREAQKKQEEQQQTLEDEEYEQIQALLESPVDPTLDIGEFNAFNSVTADAHASTVAAQAEALYRDMNGMLVTLGLNARALAGFIKGHDRGHEMKTKHDLENSDDWVLCEAEDLNHVLDEELAPELEEGRVQDIEDTWDTCQSILREMPKLRAKKQDLKRVLDTVLDPDQAAGARAMPLSAEQLAQQNELRQAYARTTKLMADAEDALTMLKTKLASLSGKPSNVPTVDAIIRTIAKMTAAAEKRSGEIDILESQMRKLRMSGSAGLTPSREGSPAMSRTPPPKMRQSLIMAGSSMHTPSPLRALNNSLIGSAGRGIPSPRKKMSGFTVEEKTAIREKMEKRQAVLDRLRGRLVENGPKVSRMGDAR